MTLKRQLVLVSLLTLMLPWAGCEFIRETESALRATQQQMLAGTARAIADSMAQYAEEFPPRVANDFLVGDQLFAHRLPAAATIDGYFDDWALDTDSLETLRGRDGPVRFALGVDDQYAWLYVAVTDRNVVYASAESLDPATRGVFADRVSLVSTNPPYLDESISFAAEAPGPFVAWIQDAYEPAPEPTIRAHFQDVPSGYQVEARIPLNLLGTNLGLVVENTDSVGRPGVRSASFSARSPGPFVTASPDLESRAVGLVQPGMRMIVTDARGFRLATVGQLKPGRQSSESGVSRWMRFAYDALVEPGTDAALAAPDPRGREQQDYIVNGLEGRPSAAWFRSEASGQAIVAVAEPVRVGGTTVGAVVLQQGTDAILSLTNQGLARLMNVTLIAMLGVAIALIGYASWLSRRIRRLSVAAVAALDDDRLHRRLPSSEAADEIGDLSRSFSNVLGQLGDYNDYLRTLASKLSHELRTPLAIVTSSLENLEHEQLDSAAEEYASRAKDGADRLRRILSAMSEASRVEELIRNVEPETFDLYAVVDSTVIAYRDVYRDRGFCLTSASRSLKMAGSPELVIQMLDKLVDNAVSFSQAGAEIEVSLSAENDAWLLLDVYNPGPPLPEKMRGQLFDSMISVRPARNDKHLGLGLHIARIIAEGHGGRIDADNVDDGVKFSVWLPAVPTAIAKG